MSHFAQVSWRRLLPILTLSGFIALGLAFVLVRDLRSDFPKSPWYDEAEMMSAPHGRVLSIVVEREGAFVGEICIPHRELAGYLQSHRAQLAPDYVIVAGTEEATYGDFATTFTAVRSVFRGVGATTETRSLPVGTRRPRLIRIHGWGYPRW